MDKENPPAPIYQAPKPQPLLNFSNEKADDIERRFIGSGKDMQYNETD